MPKPPILGFRIAGYRSFADEPQTVGPLKKINIFIGENNSGKSNILRFIRDVYQPVVQGERPVATDSALPQGGSAAQAIGIMLPSDQESLRSLDSKIQPDDALIISKLLGSSLSGSEFVLDVSLRESKIVSPLEPICENVTHNDHRLVHNAWHRITGQSSGDLQRHWVPDILKWYYSKAKRPIKVHYIPTLRQIPTKLEDFKAEYGGLATGATIADDLAALSNPDHTRPSERKKFESILEFMRGVLKRPSLELSVPHDKSTIIVEDYGRYLPIESLGTGIHQLLILAVKAILVDESVICVEEPELHMHPELQQQLMHFLSSKTNNQYFITTHSATIMDSVEADVYSVRLDEDGHSLINRSISKGDRRSICHSLGYRPSDLLQANSLVWVEGPTDRRYLLNWLASADPTLEEGWHFSIMFYGGRLASNLTVLEDASGLIDLLPINRFPAIIIDSDKRKKGQHVNATKKRLSDEFVKAGGFAWITDGREIENYVLREIREEALRGLEGNSTDLHDVDDQYGHPIAFGSNGEDKPDKVEFAKMACVEPLSLEVLDLKSQVRALVQFIRKANKMD